MCTTFRFDLSALAQLRFLSIPNVILSVFGCYTFMPKRWHQPNDWGMCNRYNGIFCDRFKSIMEWNIVVDYILNFTIWKYGFCLWYDFYFASTPYFIGSMKILYFARYIWLVVWRKMNIHFIERKTKKDKSTYQLRFSENVNWDSVIVTTAHRRWTIQTT